MPQPFQHSKHNNISLQAVQGLDPFVTADTQQVTKWLSHIKYI